MVRNTQEELNRICDKGGVLHTTLDRMTGRHDYTLNEFVDGPTNLDGMRLNCFATTPSAGYPAVGVFTLCKIPPDIRQTESFRLDKDIKGLVRTKARLDESLKRAYRPCDLRKLLAELIEYEEIQRLAS